MLAFLTAVLGLFGTILPALTSIFFDLFSR